MSSSAKMRPNFLSRISTRQAVCLLLLVTGAVYVGNRWSPSSYALALRMFQAPDDGLDAGTPQPVRSDEWAVITPLTQATVNGGFDRYNKTSLYEEDLRSTYSLPILDWGFAFKPTMWLYPFVNPAYAFSFHHFALFALFLVGHAWLFARLGIRPLHAALLSCSLLFTGFSQYWWTTLGPPLAFFPWVLLIFLAKGPLLPRMLAFYWTATCWMLSFFYPPLFIPQAFLAAVMLLAWKPESLRPRAVLGFGLSAVLASLTTLLYLKDWLSVTLNTLYPGQRRVGGGGYGLERALSHLFPTAEIQNHQTLVTGSNVCEMAVVGSFYVLMVLCFLRYRGLREAVARKAARAPLVLLVGFLLVAAWMFLPLPHQVGMPLLWHFVPPPRMAFLAGALLLLLAYALADVSGLELSPPRVALFAGVVLTGWFVFKFSPHGVGLLRAWKDVLILLPLAAITGATLAGRLKPSGYNPALLAAATAVAFLSFGNFNPLQDAWPIFNRPETEATRRLDAMVEMDPHRRLVQDGFPGAILNGWGYASASHVLVRPQLEKFRPWFPELPEAQFNEIFNRYAHLILTHEPAPSLIQADAVRMPRRVFVDEPQIERFLQLSGGPERGPLPETAAGHIDTFGVEGNKVELTGWAPWEGVNNAQGLELRANRTITRATLQPIIRPDVAVALGNSRYLHSGFLVRLELEGAPQTGSPAADGLELCVVAVDREAGTAVRLHTPPGLAPCR